MNIIFCIVEEFRERPDPPGAGHVGSFLDERGQRGPLDDFDPSRNQKVAPSGRATGGTSAEYISNFIFSPA